MREIGLGKELGDSPQKNVVHFIGCVTSHSKKAILCILSFLLFKIYTYLLFFFFVCLFVKEKTHTCIVLRNISINIMIRNCYGNYRFGGFRKTAW